MWEQKKLTRIDWVSGRQWVGSLWKTEAEPGSLPESPSHCVVLVHLYCVRQLYSWPQIAEKPRSEHLHTNILQHLLTQIYCVPPFSTGINIGVAFSAVQKGEGQIYWCFEAKIPSSVIKGGVVNPSQPCEGKLAHKLHLWSSFSSQPPFFSQQEDSNNK